MLFSIGLVIFMVLFLPKALLQVSSRLALSNFGRVAVSGLTMQSFSACASCSSVDFSPIEKEKNLDYPSRHKI